MAFGMRYWIATMVAGFAVVAAWRLPPEPVGSRSGTVASAEQLRFEELNTEAQAVAGMLLRTTWADSLAALVVARAEDGPAVATPLRGEAAEAMRLRLEARVRTQLAERPNGGSAMAFGYVVQHADHRQLPGASSPRSRTETYAGTRGGVDYCLQVRVTRGDPALVVAKRLLGDDIGVPPYRDELGPCRFYVSYGFPGPRIEAWLEAGGVELAFEGEAPLSLESDDMLYGRRGPLGLTYVRRGPGAAEVNRCLAGVVAECEAFFTGLGGSYFVTPVQQEIVRGSAAVGLGSLGMSEWLPDRRHVLADLEAEFGEAAFHGFWTSPEPVDRAFASAFGISAGSWLVQRIERAQGVDPPGPGISRHVSSMSMLTIAAFLGLAYRRRRERAVVT